MKNLKTRKMARKLKPSLKRAVKSRPSKKSKRWIVPTMAAASGATGIPLEALKLAKASGCEAFSANSNVDCDELIKFLAANPKILEDAGAAVNMQVEEALTARAERVMVEMRLAKIQEKLIPLDEAKRDLTRCIMELKRKAFALPRRLAQIFALESDAINIEQRMISELHEIFSSTAKEKWAGFECPHCKNEIES